MVCCFFIPGSLFYGRGNPLSPWRWMMLSSLVDSNMLILLFAEKRHFSEGNGGWRWSQGCASLHRECGLLGYCSFSLADDICLVSVLWHCHFDWMTRLLSEWLSLWEAGWILLHSPECIWEVPGVWYTAYIFFFCRGSPVLPVGLIKNYCLWLYFFKHSCFQFEDAGSSGEKTCVSCKSWQALPFLCCIY